MKTTLASIIFIILTLTFINPAFAQTMTNGSFRIQMGNLNSIAGESAGSNYKLNQTSGETAPGLYSGTNYKVRAGFQYIPRGGSFSFSISHNLIDFGILSPTNPVTRTTTLTISNSSSDSYQVTTSENHQLLSSKTGAIIPDTTCDSGNCKETTAGLWSSTLTYGFGFRCDSVSITSADSSKAKSCKDDDKFSISQNNFKQFADVSKSEKAQIIIKGGKGKSQKAQVTYKVNIPSSQATGNYSNSITYIATPGF